MPTRNINLTDHFDKFIESSIAAGRFANASEAMRAGLHLLERESEEHQAKLDWLRSATREAFAALDQGEGIALSSAEDIAKLVNGAVERARAKRLVTHA